LSVNLNTLVQLQKKNSMHIADKTRHFTTPHLPRPGILTVLMITSFITLAGVQHAMGAKLLYVYSYKSVDDSIRAVQFKAFFDSLGHTTTLTKANGIGGLNLAQYALLIIGSGTGGGLGWEGDPASITAIKNSGKPIIAMGYGGPNLFDSLHLWCGWGQSAGGNGGGELIHDRSHPIFTTPAVVQVSGGDSLIIDVGGWDGQALYVGGTVPSDVILFGQTIIAPGYAALALEKNKYFYWGFAGPPTDLTRGAKQLLANIVYYLTVTITGVDDEDASVREIPSGFALLQNYPNPFNPVTKIGFRVSGLGSRIRLGVYDLLGREVAVLMDETRAAGTFEAEWNAAGYASGTYICRLTAGDYVESRKMILMK
jgi:hypothetical protein